MESWKYRHGEGNLRSPAHRARAGGAALGAYQGGAYAVLHEAGLRPNLIAGSSIGAVNAAIIAVHRVRR